MIQSFDHIDPVPQAKDLIDIALSKTNRKTPTVIHPGYEIQRIRLFYVRKVKFSCEEFTNRLSDIVKQFPVLEDIHPFYADLISVLYDRDHFKIALSQLNSCKNDIMKIAAEHTKLLNFGDSMFRCKQLKRAALGKMATQVKKLVKPLTFLEEVRQHLSRLPSIDTSSRTLIICGYPNVGKSSFMNKVSKAHVDVQPYAFTTKSLFVGHFEYENLKWQILDTPGILDHPLEERNTIEMLTITALAHLKSAVIFFMDLSETCGYGINQQIALYESLTPLLSSQILIVLSKCDVLRLDQLHLDVLNEFLSNKTFVEISSDANINIDLARNTICDMLLNERVTEKQDKICNFTHRIKPFIPQTVNQKTEERGHLGPNLFLGLPDNETYFCDNKYDIIPEFFNGKNVSDFLDENIQDKLQVLLNEDSQQISKFYDVMTPEQRRMYEDCNNARIHANLMSVFNKRASVPLHSKNPIKENNASLSLTAANPVVKPTSTVPRETRNKKVQAAGSKKQLTMKPKHLFRPTANKHS